MNMSWLFSLPLLLISLSSGEVPAAHKMETIGACTNAEVSQAVQNSLQPNGLRVAGDSGVFCEIWLRKVIPQKSGSSGTEYTTIANGTFVGVIDYPSKAGDYRGQAIRVGTYTLRYHTIPQDGNHLGVSPTPDFFLLVPAAADKDPNVVIDSPELMKLSKQASGTNHPNPLTLTPPKGAGAATFREAGEGHWALETKTKAQASGGGAEIDFPVSIVLIGKAEG